MDLERLLPEPPEGFKIFDPPHDIGARDRVWAKYAAGYAGGQCVVWVADSPASPIKVVEIAVATYDTPSLAKRVSKAQKAGEAIVRTVGEGASLSKLEDGSREISWSAGSVRFTSIYRLVRHAIVECMAVSDNAADPTAVLQRLHSEVADRLPVIPDVPAITPAVRQLAYGFVLGIVIVAAILGTTAAVGYDGNQIPFFVAIFAALLGWRWWRRTRLRRLVIEQGDRDGTIRRALAGLGITLA